MRRWNLLFLVALVAVLAAALSITPSRARAATSPSFNFSGKVVATISTTNYFVDTFTCSLGALTSKWYYDFKGMASYGTLKPGTDCALISTDNGTTWSTATMVNGIFAINPLTATLVIATSPNVTGVTLALFLENVEAHKTFFSSPCPTPSQCINVTTKGFTDSVQDFPLNGASYASSLTLSVS